MFQNCTAEKNSSRKHVVLPTRPFLMFVLWWGCSSTLSWPPGVSLVNYLPTPPPPLVARWRRLWQTWGLHPFPAAPQGLCSSPTYRRHPLRLRPHRTDSQRTSGGGLKAEKEKTPVILLKLDAAFLLDYKNGTGHQKVVVVNLIYIH